MGWDNANTSTLIFAAIKKLDTIYFRTPCKFETLLGHQEYSETPLGHPVYS